MNGHYLAIELEASNRFYEKHVGRSGEWDRACCCEEMLARDMESCKYSWSESGHCCKFKYGDIARYGCSIGWFSKSKLKVDDDNCWSGPEVPPFPGWKSAEFVD